MIMQQYILFTLKTSFIFLHRIYLTSETYLINNSDIKSNTIDLLKQISLNKTILFNEYN